MTNFKFSVLKSKLLSGCGLLALAGLSLAGCRSGSREPAEAPLFQVADTTQTGVRFVNKLQHTEELNILDYLYYYNGAGVAAGDVNNDGLSDLYFVSNQGKNKLYLNKGKMQFADVTQEAGVEGFSDWQTGVSMADVNGDGLLDIYVCAVGNYKGLEGANELYINEGVDAQGQVHFSEKAAEYGLDFTGFATQAAFFDFDRDGDLDVYLLNHAVHTSRSYDRVSTRHLVNNEAGDYLLENQHITAAGTTPANKTVKFKDVSKKAGIYQAAMGYGLGIVVSDLNNDGWDDIYVSNDFHEDDYYYLNNGNGTFTESVKNSFRHLSRYSMGCDAADMNNDGYPDVMTLDMYPEDEKVEKSSMGEDPYDIYLYKLQYGYFNQYSRNCLQMSIGGQQFYDVGMMAGVAATDWSWSTLLADYDNDGVKDIFISNGIVRRPNNLDYVKFASDDSLRYAMETSKSLDNKAISMMPDGKVHNYLFRGRQQLAFEDKSLDWGLSEPSISNGAAYADLDNDGDLDLVTNNINQVATIYQNNSERLVKNKHLKVRLKGDKANTFGYGAKVYLIHQNKVQTQQLHPTRGFMSSVEPVLNFGLGKQAQVDSVVVIWGNQLAEVRTQVKANTTLVLEQAKATLPAGPLLRRLFPAATPILEEVKATSIAYQHAENNYLDFYRESLMPFQVSTEGPKLAVGDINNDGLEDFYVGGAKWQAGQLFLQGKNQQFRPSSQPVFQADSTFEDVDAVFFDADNDKDLDLYVVSGGNEFYGKMSEQFDRLYLNDGRGNFSRSQGLPPMYDNKSCVRPADYDGDGDQDLFVGGRVTGYKYGMAPNSYLLINDGKGRFSNQTRRLAPALQQAGMLTDGRWVDVDGDGDLDLMVVGDWMPVMLFENQKGKLSPVAETGLESYTGLWQALQGADFDKDGDLDFVVGNLGTNTKLRKGPKGALKMYVHDLDGNGTTDQILASRAQEQWFPVANKDELGKQMPHIHKKFTDYTGFAGKTIEEIFDKEELGKARMLEVNTFESVYLENTGNKKFQLRALPVEAQVSKVYAFHIADVNADGALDVVLGGNQYGVSTYQGRYDSSYGLILMGNGKGRFRPVLPAESGMRLDEQVRDIKPLQTPQGKLLLVARNGLPLQVFRASAVKGKSPDTRLAQTQSRGL